MAHEFLSFDEFVARYGLTPDEVAEQDRWGATVGERFDTEEMRRYFARRMAEHAARTSGLAAALAE